MVGIKPRSPLGRAVLPVLGGLAVLALIFAATFGIAAWISRGGAESTPRLAPDLLHVGGVETVADSIADSGPLLFPGLDTLTGERTVVLDHTGDDPTRGWRLYLAYPADGDSSCGVSQVRGTRTFIDCNGDQLAVSELARPTDACPVVQNRETVSIGLSRDICN